jgi:hypothetical protein
MFVVVFPAVGSVPQPPRKDGSGGLDVFGPEEPLGGQR